MGTARQALIFPTLEQIVGLNRAHIDLFGGFYAGVDNFRNRHSLEWVQDAIQYPLFGRDPYPSLEKKAAVLTWVIIAEHVFHDGNKRTGISTLKIAIVVNKYGLRASHEELVDIALRLASADESKLSSQDLADWIHKRIYRVTP